MKKLLIIGIIGLFLSVSLIPVYTARNLEINSLSTSSSISSNGWEFDNDTGGWKIEFPAIPLNESIIISSEYIWKIQTALSFMTNYSFVHYYQYDELTGNEYIIKTIVTSELLKDIAIKTGVECIDVLTGFKWICNRAIDLEQKENFEFLFGYEEAIGYTAGTFVRDKDGITAACLMAEIAENCKGKGISILQFLYEIYREIGLYINKHHNIVFKEAKGMTIMTNIMKKLRKIPPKKIGDY